MLQRALFFSYAWPFLLIPGCAAAGLSTPSVTTVQLGQVINKNPGIFQPQGGQCQAALEVSDMGGFLTLSFTRLSDRGRGESVSDVTGLAWITDDLLVFTVSPIYGKPGVFAFSCSARRIRRIVAPQTVDKAYPDGADDFELHSVSAETGGKVRFYYAPDVDRIDYNRFRTDAFLFEVRLDGSGFRKVTQ